MAEFKVVALRPGPAAGDDVAMRERTQSRAVELRKHGKTIRQIADALGIGISTAQRYANVGATGVCGSCAGTCSPNALLCNSCAGGERTVWTAALVLAAIRRFHDRYGRQPSAMDFNPGVARFQGHLDRAERFEEDGDYPSVSSVQKVFGSWAAAIEAAGFTPYAVRIRREAA